MIPVILILVALFALVVLALGGFNVLLIVIAMVFWLIFGNKKAGKP